jgi:hypothetical protein
VARSTSQLRSLWGPPCRVAKITISLYGTGRVTVDRRIAQPVYEFNRCLARHRYASIYAQTGAYVCRDIAGTGEYSLHAYATAIDLNWLRNGQGRYASTDLPAALVRDIESIRTNSGAQVWFWGGHWDRPDYMHIKIEASPAEIASGIRRGIGSQLPQPVDDEEFTMDAEARQVIAALQHDVSEIKKGQLVMQAKLDEAGQDWWSSAARRTRLLLEHFKIPDTK